MQALSGNPPGNIFNIVSSYIAFVYNGISKIVLRKRRDSLAKVVDD